MTKTRTGLMIFALFAASLNLRPAINSVSPILETLRHDLGMTASAASLLTSIPVLCMGIFSPLAAKLGGRFGIERILGWALVLIGLGTALRLFTMSAAYLLMTAFLAGVGIAATGPLLSGFIKRHFATQIPLMISLYSMALTVGAAFASGITAPLETGTDSWHAALGIWAVFALLAIPVWWLVVMQHVRREHTARVSSIVPDTKFPLRNVKAWLITLSFGLMSMMFYSTVAWLPPMIEEMGFGKLYAGNVFTVFIGIQVPVMLLLPLIMKRYPSRLLLLLLFSAFELTGFVMMYFAAPPWISGTFLGIGAGAIFTLNLLLPIDATATPQEAANWSSMAQSVGYMIGASGPLLIGWLHDSTGNFASSIISLILVNAVMMLVQVAAVPRLQNKSAQVA